MIFELSSILRQSSLIGFSFGRRTGTCTIAWTIWVTMVERDRAERIPPVREPDDDVQLGDISCPYTDRVRDALPL